MRRRLVAAMGALLCPVAAPADAAADADLAAFVAAPDPSFSWSRNRTAETTAGTVHHLDLTSQTWRGIPWTHQLRIYEPNQVASVDLMLLFITGGSSSSQPRPEDDVQGFALAEAAGCRVAVLPQVPNQPLLGGRTEDDLIAETFVNYLRTGEADWPLLQPMVKSAVRAMDAAQAFAAEQGMPVSRFVVTGASKRGWTTWLTGAVDDRVSAIAPMVIPTLNMKENVRNQKTLWNVYSEQIEDYTTRGLTETFSTDDGAKLWQLVDPYFYLDQIEVPVLQINGTNDRYWTHDSMRFYWDEIRGPRSVVYLPNAGHGLDEHRDYAINGIGALVRHVAVGRDLPEFRWEASGDGTINIRLDVVGKEKPTSIEVWIARSDDRDFRDDPWTIAPLGLEVDGDKGGAAFSVPRPDSGSIAAFYDLGFEIDGLPYHLSTPIHEFRADPAEDLSAGESSRPR